MTANARHLEAGWHSLTRADRIALASAAGQDAGNRRMRAAGRTVWDAEDWNAAARVANRLRDAWGLDELPALT